MRKAAFATFAAFATLILATAFVAFPAAGQTQAPKANQKAA